MISELASTVPGWYGKLPGLGDFASRRLPSDFINGWDDWLQQRLAASRVTLGERWLDCYLTTPIWRFVVLPGLLGSTGWAGVLMPSVDRVGRQFPLTLAAGLPSHAAAAHAVFDESAWFAGLEEAALAMLDITRNVDDLERSLAKHPFEPPLVPDPVGEVGALRALPSMEQFGLLVRAEALREWGRHSGWKSLWWSRGRIDDHPLMLASAAMPTPEEFSWLLLSRSTPAPTVAR